MSYFSVTYSTTKQRCDAKKRWREAKTLSELCELTALFIEGRSPFLPGYSADDVAEETNIIRQPLARLNRCGFLTTFSQPGLADEHHRQRAAVDGFTTKDKALKLVELNGFKRLLVQVYAPGSEGGVRACVTESPIGTEFTWTGDESFDYTYYCFRCLNATAMRELKSLWFVSVIDPVWERNDVLWDVVSSAVER